MWVLTLKDLTETEESERRWEEGTGGSCWVSADGLTQFQGTQWSQRLISKRQIVILSSVATVCWVHLQCGGRTQGRRPGPGERTTLWWGPHMGGNWKRNCLRCVWKCIEMKIGADSDGGQSNPLRKALNWFWPDWAGEQVGVDSLHPDNDAVASVMSLGPASPGLLPPIHVNSTPTTPTHERRNTHTPSSTSIISPFFILHGCANSGPPHPLDPLLQLQSCLHRLERQTVWQHLNTSTYTRTDTQSVPCKQNRTRNPITVRHVYTPWLLRTTAWQLTWHAPSASHTFSTAHTHAHTHLWRKTSLST